MDTDVIIVGAGPAGTTAALFLINLGYQVLLIDKSDFPRSKICGDAIAPGTIDIIKELGILKKYDSLKKQKINQFRIVSPNGNTWNNPFHPKPGFEIMSIIKRIDFDDFLFKETQHHGVKFIQAKATDLLMENDNVTGVSVLKNDSSINIKAKMVIGADGVNSKIGRLLGVPLPNDRQRMIALRAYIRDIEVNPNQVEGYFYKDILPGYVWIFPLDENLVNIGLGMRLDHYRRKNKSLKNTLDEFLHSPIMRNRVKYPIKLEERGGHLLHSTYNRKNSRVFNAALLIGDAGGWVDPLTGGGICNAMISGKIAAEVIHGAMQKDDFSTNTLMEYEKKCKKSISNELRRNAMLHKLFISLPYGCLDGFVSFANNSKLFGMVLNRMYKDIDFR